ncbi:DUF1549 and DUF1553 domain-containing protein [Schlesneria paludicola]|uniref:DUF1549 and DUF1553 domain-containing protein n=1 Tax=Schlesneria paludicola TaxID=360056 RepID=UPI00029B2BCB|nr:DUF1549 and DUF1553 domain-containing protein [Schlesneria paludicola]
MTRIAFPQFTSVVFALIGLMLGSSDVVGQSDPSLTPGSSDELASVIDRRIGDVWKQNQVEPAPLADDAEFLRRTYLNIVGRIPSVNEALVFLDNPSPGKRLALVEQLLDSPGYLSNFTSIWRDIIIPEAGNSSDPFNQNAGNVRQFETWLRERFERNHGLDRMAREVISGNNEVPSEGNTTAFVRLKESKPENLAAGTARAFLGVRLECAQCHNHPFAKWKREDFWKLAAFYGGVQTGESAASGLGSRKIKIPELDQEVTAAFLDGNTPDFKANSNARAALAKWVTTTDNSYFAKTCVNRLWGHFFGMGIVDPIDDFDERNPASHPELLDEIAHAFIAHKYDQKFLIRAITRSQPYQLTSRRTHPSQENPRFFARMLVKGLTSDQLFDSLIWATGNVEAQQDNPNFFRVDGQRQKFRELFGQHVSAPGEVQTSILQALLMLNGVYVDQASSPEQGRTLSAIIESPFFSNEQRLEILFVAALARPPRPVESATLLKYVEDESQGYNWKQALGDVYWSLLNSSEFLLNH